MKMVFQNNLVSAMLSQGLTVEVLAKRGYDMVLAGTLKKGVQAHSIAAYRRGDTLPLKSNIETLAAMLSIPPSELLPEWESVPDSRGPRTTRALKPQVKLRPSTYGTMRIDVSARLPRAVAEKLAAETRKFLNKLGYDV
jgi:hypothetical protein